MLAVILLLGLICPANADTPSPWTGTTVNDLHNEYYNIFKYGNRNAVSTVIMTSSSRGTQ